MEQRNGRIDRKLQPRPRCSATTSSTASGPRIACCRPWSARRRRSSANWAAWRRSSRSKLADTLGHGIRHADVDRLEARSMRPTWKREAAHAVEEELEAARERQDELRSRSTACATCSRTRATGSAWRRIISGPPSPAPWNARSRAAEAATATAPTGPRRFVFPALDAANRGATLPGPTPSTPCARRAGAIRSSGTGGASPRSGPWSSRTPDTMTEDVVHLHLEHRVVQRLLGRFTARASSTTTCRRACLAQTDGPDPARRPDRPALPLRRRRGPAARGADRGHRPLGRPA